MSRTYSRPALAAIVGAALARLSATALIVVTGTAHDKAQAQIICPDCTYCGVESFNALGFDGIKATVEVHPTTTNPSPNIKVWCGLDWNATFWIQTGWLSNGSGSRAFIEYLNETGIPGGSEPGGVSSTGEYVIYRDNEFLRVTIFGVQYATYYWASFDRLPMCKAYIGAEMKGQNQHVPGVPGNPCDITGVQTREFVFGGWISPSMIGTNSSQCGWVSVGSGALSIWDERFLNQFDCP